jgi:hypothetical protein
MRAIFQDPANRTYNERSEIDLVVRFLNDSGALEAPAALQYRIDNPETGEEVLAWTNLSPASSLTITVTPAQNAASPRIDQLQARQLLLRNPTSGATLGRHEWKVRPLQGLT